MRSSTLTALCATLLLAFGCATAVSLPDRLDQFVEKTEKEYKNYDENDWKKSREEYDAIMAEVEENYDSYTTEEKIRIVKASGRYGVLMLGKEISGGAEKVGGVLEKIPETINDVIDNIDTTAIREGVENIKKGIEGLTESIDTARLREKLEAIIKIFTEDE